MKAKSQQVTSVDVAREAGVSRTTVSFVLNGTHLDHISNETIERVRRTAETLGYVPNASARSLVSGKTRTLAIYIREHRLISIDMFTARMLEFLAKAVNQFDYRLLIASADARAGRQVVDLARSHEIDGVIVLDPPPGDTSVERLVDFGLPVVWLATSTEYPISTVGSSDVSAMRLLAAHLDRQGFDDVGYIHYAPSPDGFSFRGDALRSSLLSLDRPIAFTELGAADFSPSSGYEETRRILSGRKPPRVIAYGNDTVAIGGMAAIREAGYRIPQDIAVTGFDNTPAARFLSPTLTTLAQDAEGIAAAAASELVRLVTQGNGAEPRHRGFETVIKVRESTRRD